MQMSGLRLDRRADAMRGSSQTLIGPGNAAGSKLYHRLTGTAFGQQMPPGRPLTAEQIETIRTWIDEGAEWPDAASGEPPPVPVDPNTARLLSAIRDGDRAAIDQILHATPHAATLRGHTGTTPLMSAALYGDAGLVTRLLDLGADPNAANASGATALMWAIPDRDKLQRLLDAGADVNARSDDRRAPITIAAGIVGASPAVALLLEYGADPWPWRASELSPLRESARANDPDTFRLLLDVGLSLKAAGAPSSDFVRTNCPKCGQL